MNGFSFVAVSMRTLHHDMEMKFGIEKCAVLIMKKGEKEPEPHYQVSIRIYGKNYKYLGILKVDTT